MELLSFVSIGILIGFLVSVYFRVAGVSMANDMWVAVAGALTGGFLFGSLNLGSDMIWQTVGASALGAVSFLLISHIVIASTHRRAEQ